MCSIFTMASRYTRLWLLLLPLSLLAGDERIVVGHFSAADLFGWEARTFKGETDYRLEQLDGTTVLRAWSKASASGRYRKVDIDLERYPYLNWSWRIDNQLAGLDERSKAGDDYPARVYVVFSGGLAFWRTRAINYVWSSNQPPGSRWDNAFTANAKMVAVQAGTGQLGKWVTLQRNVAKDYRQLFGKAPGKVDAVAIMSDTDNSGKEALAWYGDIWFSMH